MGSTFKSTHGHLLQGSGIKHEHSKIVNKHDTNHDFASGILKITKKDKGYMSNSQQVSDLACFIFSLNIISQVTEYLQAFIENWVTMVPKDGIVGDKDKDDNKDNEEEDLWAIHIH